MKINPGMYKVLILFSILLTGIFPACGSSNLGTALLRIYQASPDSPALEITLDGNAVASGLTYQQDTGYLTVEEGPGEIRVKDDASGDTRLILDPVFAPGTDYTVVLVNPLVAVEALILTDDNSPPPAGDFKFRFLHMAPSAGDVDVYLLPSGGDVNTTNALVGGVEYKGGTNYFPLDAGTLQIALTAAGQKTLLKSSGNITFNAGSIRSAVLLDNLGGGTPFLLQILSDLN